MLEQGAGCFGGDSRCRSFVINASCLAACCAESVSEYLAWKCSRSTMGAVAHVLYWRAGRLGYHLIFMDVADASRLDCRFLRLCQNLDSFIRCWVDRMIACVSDSCASSHATQLADGCLIGPTSLIRRTWARVMMHLQQTSHIT